MNKVLTISVAAYNVEKYLRECIESFVCTSVFEDLEIIIVNDGSVDGTLKIAKEYEAKYPDSIVVIDKENGGHGSTINASIKRASGRYYKVVDSDDWVNKEGIEKLIAFLKDKDVDLVLNPYIKISPDKMEMKTVDCLLERSNKSYVGKIKEIDEYFSNISVAMHAFTFKTEILKRIKPLDEKCFYVDVEYTLYPLPLVKMVAELDYPVYMYRFGTAEQSMNIKNMVKRIGQHYKVLIHSIEYYSLNEKNTNPVISNIIYRRLLDVISMQYTITFAIPDAEKSYLHYCRLDRMLRKKYQKFYKNVIELEGNRGMKIVRILRKYNNNKKIYNLIQCPLALALNNNFVKIK